MIGRAEIRVASEIDGPVVAAYREALAGEQLETLLAYEPMAQQEVASRILRPFEVDPNRVFLVALAAGEVVGHLDLVRGDHPQQRHVAMLGMAVLAPHRGLGIGSRLIEAGLAWAGRRGLHKIQLEVLSNNPRAQALYERIGFEREGARLGFVRVGDDFVDLVQMGLWLGPIGPRLRR